MVRRLYASSDEKIQNRLVPLALPELFKWIYYHLYTNSNIPRAERLGAEMTRILFCKINDELNHKDDPQMCIHSNESNEDIGKRVRTLFELTKTRYADVFSKDDRLYLDDKSIAYIVKNLEQYQIVGTSRDVISEAFQAFWGPGLRGEKGQFFTPRNVVGLCVDILGPSKGDKIIDPACGSGGFLIEIISRFLESENKSKKESKVLKNIFGIDKEVDLAKICKIYMALIGDGHSNVFCLNSLDTDSWSESALTVLEDGSFDIVLTNPPFGAKISVVDPKVLRNYTLGYKWIKNNFMWSKSNHKLSKQSPQILFLERCLQLLKPGGRMAIVLPDGIFGNSSDRYILKYVTLQAKILAVISLSQETFMPSTHTKTSVLFLEKQSQLEGIDYDIFMAIAEKVGHDKNGKRIYKINNHGDFILDKKRKKIVDDDLPEIAKRFHQHIGGELPQMDHLGFTIPYSKIVNSDHILIPNYYNPEIQQSIEELRDSGKYDIMSIGQLISRGLLSIKRGNEVGSKYYGMGNVPFVRTSDISNWEIKNDPIKAIPEEVYNKYNTTQDVKDNDLLIISDGTFLIGRTAIVTSNDEKIVIQSHIKKIRCLNPKILDPYLLLYLLNTNIVKQQIMAKTFVQATISTLGNRFTEIILPIPKDKLLREKIISEISEIVKMKLKVKQKISKVINESHL